MSSAAAASKEPELDVDLEPVADETAYQAQRIVASYAADADECLMLLEMLGIGPEKVDPADAE
ncbi:hypothetical protein H483_0102335 [Dietzia sp. UCD-THP]|uniref:Uncharacterized protein n=1 Tax=Dietzia natronolimnaea TaxID=161920 RepID=A0A2A2WMS2_9ACTN|nr:MULTISPECIES: hypothetical protein [Dietzia]EYT65067.1 hypothetical protein H483_0102335 [Dietzia sp. UCD-THP]PAY22519.1 hypothetical protein CEY15_13375 [Dietzia natronolimnaea]